MTRMCAARGVSTKGECGEEEKRGNEKGFEVCWKEVKGDSGL